MPRSQAEPARVFVSHSSANKNFAQMVVSELRVGKLQPWIDSEHVFVGDDILDRLGEGLTTMDLLLFLISRPALRSNWVNQELKFATREEITRKQILITPFIIDDTTHDELPWFLRHRHIPHVNPDKNGALDIAHSVHSALQRRFQFVEHSISSFEPDSRIESLLDGIRPGDWTLAANAALQLLRGTELRGDNELFRVLLRYPDCPDDKRLFGALHVLESCAELAPSLFDHEILSRMAYHPNFSVRSTAASICMRWAQYAPALVPIDLVMKLSVHNEDWYVERPAVAAIQSMARAVPLVLSIFYSRLASADPDERTQAAEALADIAAKEPEILEPDHLHEFLELLRKMGDSEALRCVEQAWRKARSVSRHKHWKYGL